MCEMHLCSAEFCKADNMFSLSVFHECARVWCAHTCMGICADTQEYTCPFVYIRAESGWSTSGIISSCSSTLFFEAGYLSQTQSSDLAGSPSLNLLRLALHMDWHSHPAVTWLPVLMSHMSSLRTTFSKHYLVMILWDIKWPDTSKYDNDFIKKRI